MNALIDVIDVIRSQSEAIQRAYHAGHEAGYTKGFTDATNEARKLLDEAVGLITDNAEVKP